MIGADLTVLFVPFLDGSSNRVEAGTDLEDDHHVISTVGSFNTFFCYQLKGERAFKMVAIYFSKQIFHIPSNFSLVGQFMAQLY